MVMCQLNKVNEMLINAPEMIIHASYSPLLGPFQAQPLVRREHGQEVSSVAWSLVRSHQAVISTSWDGTAKQVRTQRPALALFRA